MDNRDIDELLSSNKKLFSEMRYKILMDIVAKKFDFDPRRIFLIYEIPEQGEDIYTLALNGSQIITVEIERKTGKYSIVEEGIDNFSKKNGRSKLMRRKINAVRYLMDTED